MSQIEMFNISVFLETIIKQWVGSIYHIHNYIYYSRFKTTLSKM